MSRELKNRIIELKQYLYPNGTETNEVDKVNLQKALFKLLRECLKEGKYEVDIGSYTINVNPQNLSVCYENAQTTVEVSNNDVFYETIRDIPVRFFVISNTKQEEYPSDTPIIRTLGIVTNIDGIMEETYDIELYTNDEDNVRNYIDLKDGFNVSPSREEDSYAISVKRRIRPNDYFTKIETILTEDKIVPVTLDINTGKYILQSEYQNDLNYHMLLPNLEDKKNVVGFLYSSMVEFYTNYI